MARVAIYTRVSTDRQTTQNQLDALQGWAARSGHEVVAVYEDKGISGAKGREHRPAFDKALKGCTRREFDILAVWSSDRLGRSLPHLVEVLSTIRDTGTGLYIHSQALDTSTSSGRALFGMLAVFAELEREIITDRIHAGIARAKKHGTKSGKAIGRPRTNAYSDAAVHAALLAGMSVRKAAKNTGASPATVHGMRKAMVAAGEIRAEAGAAA